ncbi:MAG: ABC transporter permease subunit [Verrucomicrobiota bacterium]
MFSKLTIRQFKRFRSIKRAWISLWILSALFILSLFSEQIANDKPLLLGYNGAIHFPTLKFYSDQKFGGLYKTEADYKKLDEDPAFHAQGGWMLFPPVRFDPYSSDWSEPGAPPHAPSLRHPLGTDNAARDVFARILYGFRTGMLFSLALTVISTITGFILGAVQGYAGRYVDLAMQRIIEMWSALPFLYVVILMASIYGQNFAVLLLVFCMFRWIATSYYIRAEFLRLKNQTFVHASKATGSSHLRIIFSQILPNSLNPVITLFPFGLITGISSLTALDFLGFGLAPPEPSWGELLQQGLQNLTAPWVAISSVTALFITLLLASFIGEGARAAFDTKAEE